jgi:integrase
MWRKEKCAKAMARKAAITDKKLGDLVKQVEAKLREAIRKGEMNANGRPKEREVIREHLGPNFFFIAEADARNKRKEVTAAGKFQLRMTIDGKPVYRTVGEFPAMTLEKATVAAGQLRLDLKDGKDPREEERKAAEAKQAEAQAIEEAKKRAVTFREATASFVNLHLRSKCAQHQAAVPRSLEKHFALLSDMPVADIGRAHLLDILERDWHVETEIKSRTLADVHRVLLHAIGKGWREKDSPVPFVRKHLPKASEITRSRKYHFAELPHRHIAEFVIELRAESSIAARALEFMVFTVLRQIEIKRLKWSFIDFEEKLIRLPGDVMQKMRLEARDEFAVPLTAQALQLLERMKDIRDGDLIFPNLGKNAMLHLMQAICERRGWKSKRGEMPSPHALRTTFQGWRSKTFAWNDGAAELAEKALSHRVGNKVRQAYDHDQQAEERRPLMQAWADFVTRGPADVIPINKAVA